MEMTITLSDLFLIIATISIVILMTLLVPLLIRAKRTTDQAELLLAKINAKIDETDSIIRSAKYAGDSLLITSKLIRSTLAPAIGQIGGISTGIKAFLSVIHKSNQHKAKETKADE